MEDFMNDKLNTMLKLRKEKSVKKAIYTNYNTQLKDTDDYYTPSMEVFIKKIKDPNILVKFLLLDVHKVRFKEKSLEIFLDFLLYRYSEKQVLKVFLKLEDVTIIHLFNGFIENIKELKSFDMYYDNNRHVNCNFHALCYSLFLYTKSMRKLEAIKKKINNTEDVLKRCIKIEKYSVKVPSTTKELCEWAKEIDAYIASCFEDIVSDDSNLYYFYKNLNLDFIIWIYKNEIMQIITKDSHLNSEQTKVSKIWKNRFFKDHVGPLPFVAIIYDPDYKSECWIKRSEF
jgi:hypothetical protein